MARGGFRRSLVLLHDNQASFLVEPLAVPTRVPAILLEPLRMAVPSQPHLIPPLPAANELMQLWYAAGI